MIQVLKDCYYKFQDHKKQCERKIREKMLIPRALIDIKPVSMNDK